MQLPFLRHPAGVLMLPLALASSHGLGATPTPGEAIYQKVCIECHAPGRSKTPAARGAPRLGDKDGWESRVSKGIDVLLSKILEEPHGKQDRPHEKLETWRGELTDPQVRSALKYMLSKAK